MAEEGGKKIGFKKLPTVYDKDGDIMKDKKWPLLIDTVGNVGSFLRHCNANFLLAMDPNDLQPETIRLAILGGLRYGKPVVLDMQDADLFDICEKQFDEVQKGLMDSILDKSILQENKYTKMIKDSNKPEYDPSSFVLLDNFCFIVLSTQPAPQEKLKSRMLPITIQ